MRAKRRLLTLSLVTAALAFGPDRPANALIAGTGTATVTVNLLSPSVSVSATFDVTSGPVPFNGDLTGVASWTNPGQGGRQFTTTAEKVRNVSPIKINEFRVGTSTNPTNSLMWTASASGVLTRSVMSNTALSNVVARSDSWESASRRRSSEPRKSAICEAVCEL